MSEPPKKEEEVKKKPPVAAATVVRKKKKSSNVAVKIPTGIWRYFSKLMFVVSFGLRLRLVY
jgi:hypothetical protein